MGASRFRTRFGKVMAALLAGSSLFAWGRSNAGEKAPTPVPTACPVLKDRAVKDAPVTVYPQVDGHDWVTWNTLSHFPYDTPDLDEEIHPKLRAKKKKFPVPEFVKRLDGDKIAVAGFMIPVEANEAGDKATSFILARSQATCCYGITPKMNEWIFVQMAKGKEAEILMDFPVTVFGVLNVGEQKKDNQAWTLYRMVSSKVSIPKVPW
ncbi:MAG TPA: DUF3299 domain-containing protein [bacterium]|nr:DUF3299 domain-containing protein [bacterium]